MDLMASTRRQDTVAQARSLADEYRQSQRAHRFEQDVAYTQDFISRIRQILPRQAAALELQYDRLTLDCTAFNQEMVRPAGIEPPFGFKGGLARFALARTLGLNFPQRVRDTDLVRFGLGRNDQDHVLAQTHMAEDLRHGHRVEVTADISSYLSSRDITLNETALLGDQIILSTLGLLDTLGQTLRPSKHILKANEGKVPGLVIMKMIRFLAEAQVEGHDYQYVGKPVSLQEPITPFSIALHLKRAMEYSPQAAEFYLEHAALRRMLPFSLAKEQKLILAIEELNRLLPDDFQLRAA